LKEPAVLGLRALSKRGAQEKCYLAELASCDGVISGEHLISESVMRILADDGEFTIGGTPWLPKGEFKSVGFKSLIAKCLCQRHNSALHPLDDAAASLFASLRSTLEDDTVPLESVVSGHDLERWLLKTLKAMAVSKNLGRGNEALKGDFAAGIDVISLLDDPEAWPRDAGLYCVMRSGDQMQNHLRFQLAPLIAADDSISGLWANILGLSFILMLERPNLYRIPQLRGAVHRPGAMIVHHPKVRNTVRLSWDDGVRHHADLSLKFLRKVAF
jgi:hypothetical protein